MKSWLVCLSLSQLVIGNPLRAVTSPATGEANPAWLIKKRPGVLRPATAGSRPARGRRTAASFYGMSMDELSWLAGQHEAELQQLFAKSYGGVPQSSVDLFLIRTFRWPWWPNKPVNVTCPELSNATFYFEEPFLHLALPKCGDVIQPRMTLQLEGRECSLEPAHLPNNVTTNCLMELIANSSSKKVDTLVIVTHGFLKDVSSPWMHQLAETLMNRTSTTAVLLVGWGHGSGGLPFPDPLYYYQAAANTRYMGYALATMLETLVDVATHLTNRIQPPTIHCIGHSLGAHICGFAGKELRSLGAHFHISRISGLDPAGPLFAFDVPYPFNFANISQEARLNKGDANFVDVIHTDGKPRFSFEVVPQYGTMMELGHVDFYPGEEDRFGWMQPGCWRIGDIGSCSHSRSHDLYLASLDTSCPALQTCKKTEPSPTDCQNVTGTPPQMGYPVDSDVLPGPEVALTVLTGAVPPFCGDVAKKHRKWRSRAKNQF